MPITREGNYTARINKVELGRSPSYRKAPEGSFEIVFDIVTEHSEEGEIALEWSTLPGFGKEQHKKRSELTMEQLVKLGWPGGCDFTQLPMFVGKVVQVYAKKNDKYMNVYFSSGEPRQTITPQEAMALAQRMMQEQQPQGFVAQPQAQGFGAQPTTPFPGQPQQGAFMGQQPVQPPTGFGMNPAPQPPQQQWPSAFPPPAGQPQAQQRGPF